MEIWFDFQTNYLSLVWFGSNGLYIYNTPTIITYFNLPFVNMHNINLTIKQSIIPKKLLQSKHTYVVTEKRVCALMHKEKMRVLCLK